MMFHRGGAVNFPRKAHGIWFMAQYVRFGYLQHAPDYKAIADKLILQDLYAEVAKSMKIAIPDDDMKPFTHRSGQGRVRSERARRGVRRGAPRRPRSSRRSDYGHSFACAEITKVNKAKVHLFS